MSIETIKNQISEVVSIIKKYDDELDKDGSRFNIFSILNVSSNEVRLHSNFIAELLNSKGTHGFKSKFCKLFISFIFCITDSNSHEISCIFPITVISAASCSSKV